MNDQNTKLIVAQNKMVKSSTIWVLFLFLGWSYGSMDKIGVQILFYCTLGGLGIWTIVRLFTLSGAIKDYNKKIGTQSGLTEEQLNLLGLY